MKHLLLSLTLLAGVAQAAPATLPTHFTADSLYSYNDFSDNPYTSSKEKKALKDYLLPSNHPIKPLLDAIFLTTRATANLEALQQAGFEVIKNQPRSYILVVRHPSLPGYLLKLHLDNDNRKKRGKPGWWWFSQRIKGARQLNRQIEKIKSQLFKVPQKWIYPLPLAPTSPEGESSKRKNCILVVEDMELLGSKENLEAWKTKITYDHLDQLKILLDKCGGNSYRASNIPFSVDGKIAFIDTEYPGEKPDYRTVDRYLNSEMRAYWKAITAF